MQRRSRVLVGLTIALGCSGAVKYPIEAQNAPRPELVLQLGHVGTVTVVAFSPDGRYVASGGQDHAVKIWDTRSGRLWRTLDGDFGFVAALAFSADGRLVASGSGDEIRVSDVANGSSVRTIDACDDVLVRYVSGDVGSIQPSRITAITFDPAGRWLASGCDGDAAIKLWDVTSGRLLRRISVAPDLPAVHPSDLDLPVSSDTAGVYALAASADGRWLVAGHRDRRVKVWEVASGRELFALSGHANLVTALAISRDGRFLTSSDFSAARLWRLPAGEPLRTVPGRTIAIDPDGRWLTMTNDGTIRFWNIAAGKEDVGLTMSEQTVSALSPDGRWLVSIRRGAPLVTEVATRRANQMLYHAPAPVRLALSPDARTAAVQPYFSNDPVARARVWRIGTDQFVTLPGPPGGRAAAFSADGRRLVLVGSDQALRLWDVSAGSELRAFPAPSQFVSGVAISPDGRWIAAVGSDSVCRLWDTATGRLVRTHALQGWMPSAAFSGDSRWLAGSASAGITIWELESGREVRTVDGVSPMAFSPDGRLLVTGAGQRRIRVRDVATGREIRVLELPADAASIDISSNSRWMVTRAVRQEGVTLWDLTTGRSAGTFAGHTPGFSGDGNRLRVTDADGVTRIRDARNGNLLASLVLLEDSNDWVVAAADGRFDGSALGIRRLISWRIDGSISPGDRFFAEYHTPGLLREVFGGDAAPPR